MRLTLRIGCVALAAIVLTGCGEDKPVSKPTAAAADGEILERSVSDEMIAYDSLKSQPPLAPKVVEEGSDADQQDSGSGNSDAKPPE